LDKDKLNKLISESEGADDLVAIIKDGKVITYREMFDKGLEDEYVKMDREDIKKIVVANMNILNGGVIPIPKNVFDKLVEMEVKFRKSLL